MTTDTYKAALAAARDKLRDCERRALAMIEWQDDNTNPARVRTIADSIFAITRDAIAARAEIERLEKETP